MKKRIGITSAIIGLFLLNGGCLFVDRAAQILGYVPAEEPGLVQQIENLIDTIQDDLGE